MRRSLCPNEDPVELVSFNTCGFGGIFALRGGVGSMRDENASGVPVGNCCEAAVPAIRGPSCDSAALGLGAALWLGAWPFCIRHMLACHCAFHARPMECLFGKALARALDLRSGRLSS